MRARWMRLCLTCGEFSTTLHRCDNVVDENRHGKPIECGANLVGSETPVEPFAYRTVADVCEDGLVEVEFPRICCDCGERSFIATDYSDIGLVIRYPCSACDAVTKHRPVDEDLRYRVIQLGFGVGGDLHEQSDDQPIAPTPI